MTSIRNDTTYYIDTNKGHIVNANYTESRQTRRRGKDTADNQPGVKERDRLCDISGDEERLKQPTEIYYYFFIAASTEFHKRAS